MELNGCELSNVPAPVFLRRKSRYVVGVDLGQSADPTAIAVIEHETGVIDEGSKRKGPRPLSNTHGDAPRWKRSR